MNLTRLLLIDDDVKLCRLLSDYLSPLGYEVVASHSGQDGLERASRYSWAETARRTHSAYVRADAG